MKCSKKYLLCILVFYGSHSYAQSKNDSVFNSAFISSINLRDAERGMPVSLNGGALSDKPELLIFLSPECPLCQSYTLVLNKLYQKYGNGVRFYGVISGKTYNAAAISSFVKKYKIAFPLFIDKQLALSRYLQATTTPEVILLNNRNELLYRGAIDDRVADIGKQRTRATKDFLRDALDEQLSGERVSLKRTKAIGCYINDY